MKKWSTDEIRDKWIKFFESKGHLFIPPQSLIPKDDPSLLWINSGVATMKKYFTGAVPPPCPRMVNSQKAIRTNDIFNVGVTSRHHTFFEMLGNASIGDYFKEEAIAWGFELLTKEFEFEIEKLYITVYEDDQVAHDEWVKHGINPNHILKGNRDRNFWDIGQGPCGPCTEIFYDRGAKYDPKNIGVELFFKDLENDRYVEIWNIVFSQFFNDGNNNYTELEKKNIDTGAGLERFACVCQDVPTNFDTDTFQAIIHSIESCCNSKYGTDYKTDKNFRIIADHMKANTFAIADGAIPTPKDRGSVLRKLIRRTMVCCNNLQCSDNVLQVVVESVIDTMKGFYPYLVDNKDNILAVVEKERKIFKQTLTKGYKLFHEIMNGNDKEISGKVAFDLVQTYGFPYEVIKELANENGGSVNEEEYEIEFQHHREISRANQQKSGWEVK